MHVKIGPPIHVMLYLPVVVNRVNTRVLLQLFWLSLPLCPEFLTSSPCPPITSHNTSDKGRIKCVCECQSEKNWGKGQTGGKKWAKIMLRPPTPILIPSSSRVMFLLVTILTLGKNVSAGSLKVWEEHKTNV